MTYTHHPRWHTSVVTGLINSSRSKSVESEFHLNPICNLDVARAGTGRAEPGQAMQFTWFTTMQMHGQCIMECAYIQRRYHCSLDSPYTSERHPCATCATVQSDDCIINIRKVRYVTSTSILLAYVCCIWELDVVIYHAKNSKKQYWHIKH